MHGFQTTEWLYRWVSAGIQPPMDTRTPGTIVTRDDYRVIFQNRGLQDLLLPAADGAKPQETDMGRGGS